MKIIREYKIYIFGTLIIFLAAAPIVWRTCFLTVPLRISLETTYVTEPLTSDGKRVDYFLALEKLLYPPEMKTKDNGFRMIVQSFGIPTTQDRLGIPFGEITMGDLIEFYDLGFDNLLIEKLESLRKQFYEKLDLDPDAEPTHTIKSTVDFLNEEEQKVFFDGKFWTLDDFPALADWLEESTAGIDRFAEAVRKPLFSIPMVRIDDEAPFTSMTTGVRKQAKQFNGFACATRDRARYRIGIGDIDGAIEDVLTLYHFGKHASKISDPPLFVGIEKMAHEIALGSNPKHPLTKEQLEYFLREFERLPPLVTMQEIGDQTRLERLGYYCKNFTEPDTNLIGGLFGLGKWTSKALDANVVMTNLNRFFDAVLDGRIVDVERECQPSRNPFRYWTVRSRSVQASYYVGSDLLWLVNFLSSGIQNAEDADRLKRLTFALLLYEAEHGSLPEGDWREAIKPYIGEVPDEYFRSPSGKSGYALLLYDTTMPSTPLLVEAESKNISPTGRMVDDIMSVTKERSNDGSGTWNYTYYYYNVSFRSGAVRMDSVKVDH